MKRIIYLILGMLISFNFLWADGNEKLEINLPVFEGNIDIVTAGLGQFNLRGESSTIVKLPENIRVQAAYIYFSGYSDLTPEQLVTIPILISNGQDSITLDLKCIGISTEAAQQCFTYRADVTRYILPGENRYRVLSRSLPVTPTKGFFYGLSLAVVYGLDHLPQSRIYIADGLDYFGADSGYPASSTVNFAYTEGIEFSSFAEVKSMVGINKAGQASGLWYKGTGGTFPGGDIIDTPLAEAYNNSSSPDADIDTNPLDKKAGQWGNLCLLNIVVPVISQDCWTAIQLESQTDHPVKEPFEGVWNYCIFKLPRELYGYGMIGDRVWYDRNANAIQNAGEPGIPGVLASLYQENKSAVTSDNLAGVFVDSVRTNRLGFYLFQFLKAGTYYVQLDHPLLNDTNIIQTFNSNPSDWVTIDDFDEVFDIDFGFAIKGNLNRRAQFDSLGYRAYKDSVKLFWEVKPATGNLGFDIYRQSYPSGNAIQQQQWQLVNDDLIPYTGETSYSFTDTEVTRGSYQYKVADIGLDGTEVGSAVISVIISVVTPSVTNRVVDYLLLTAYPNPFNAEVGIQYSVPANNLVQLKVYNLLGELVAVLVDETQLAGNYKISWDAGDYASGVYLAQLTVAELSQIAKLVLAK